MTVAGAELVAMRNNSSAHAAVRQACYPAPTLYFGARVNFCAWELVSPQSVAGGPRATRNLSEPATTVTTGWGGRARWRAVDQPDNDL